MLVHRPKRNPVSGSFTHKEVPLSVAVLSVAQARGVDQTNEVPAPLEVMGCAERKDYPSTFIFSCPPLFFACVLRFSSPVALTQKYYRSDLRLPLQVIKIL